MEPAPFTQEMLVFLLQHLMVFIKMIIIYTPFPDEANAEKVSRMLLEKKLVACTNIFPSSSSYWWKEKIENSTEFIVFAKTSEEKAEKAERIIKKNHPYDLPAIIKIKAEANQEYENWIKKETEA